MTETSSPNPFGDGGFDLGAMLEQAQQMQSQLMAAQAELAATTIEGSAGGVTVQVSGTGELTAVTVQSGSFDGNDPESLTDLGDLVVAAFRDAKSKADAAAAAALGPMAGALGGDLGSALGGGEGAPRAPLGFGPTGG
jgi:DNA-binding YbaB/EbfC family protein